MSKIKLLRYYQWNEYSTNTEPNGLPCTGLWLTFGVFNRGQPDQYHEMILVMPSGNMYPYNHKLQVPTTLIEHRMTEMEIIEKK